MIEDGSRNFGATQIWDSRRCGVRLAPGRGSLPFGGPTVQEGSKGAESTRGYTR